MNERRFRIVTANIIIAAMLSVVLSAALLAVLPESGEEVPAGKAVYSGDPAGGKVSLMVNVYENTPAVEEIARLLAERGMSTTFFIGGKWAEKNGDALLKLAADGFELGNHGYLHRDHANLSYDANRAEILVTERLLKATLEGLGEAASRAVAPLFAPPSGSMGSAMFDAADALVHFVNPFDIADYLAGAEVTVQNVFGMQYLQSFMGVENIFITNKVAKGTMYVTPVDNIHLYGVDFGALDDAGLTYTVQDGSLIGVHHTPAYNRTSAETYVLTGALMLAEIKDYIVKVTITAASPQQVSVVGTVQTEAQSS